MKELIIVMGISGAGKSTIGKQLAKKLEIPFIDADDFHPRENVMKMSRGQALTDEDRWPWLAAIVNYVLDSHRNALVLACSALKQSYRDYLAQRLDTKVLYLSLSREEAIERVGARSGHFMPTSLVDSQLQTLEVPNDGLSLSATGSITEIVEATVSHFRPPE